MEEGDGINNMSISIVVAAGAGLPHENPVYRGSWVLGRVQQDLQYCLSIHGAWHFNHPRVYIMCYSFSRD